MEPASVGLIKIVRNVLARFPAEERPVIAWPAICGAAVAKRTRAVDFSEGVLCVEVPDRTWKAQLRDLAPRYVAEFAQFIGPGVRYVRFVLPDEAAFPDFNVKASQ